MVQENKKQELKTVQIGGTTLILDDSGKYVPQGQPGAELEVERIEDVLQAAKDGDGTIQLSRTRRTILVPVNEAKKRAEWERQLLIQKAYSSTRYLLSVGTVCLTLGLLVGTYTILYAIWEQRSIAGALINEGLGVAFQVLAVGGALLLVVGLLISARRGLRESVAFDDMGPTQEKGHADNAGGDIFINVGRNSTIYMSDAQKDVSKR